MGQGPRGCPLLLRLLLFRRRLLGCPGAAEQEWHHAVVGAGPADAEPLQLGDDGSLREQRLGLGRMRGDLDAEHIELVTCGERRQVVLAFLVVLVGDRRARVGGLVRFLFGIADKNALPAVEQFHLSFRQERRPLRFKTDGGLFNDARRGLAGKEPGLYQRVRLPELAFASRRQILGWTVGDGRSNGLVRALDVATSRRARLPASIWSNSVSMVAVKS